MLIHDIIKTSYVVQGYLPDYPYHLISDEEMFSAFLSDGDDYFSANYPCPTGFEDKYSKLVEEMHYHINTYLYDHDPKNYVASEDMHDMPDWIYSYMLGVVVGPNSHEQDRHDLFVLLDLDNMEDEFNDQIYSKIYSVSQQWLYKLSFESRIHRPPTIFGEPHVIKSLRLYYS